MNGLGLMFRASVIQGLGPGVSETRDLRPPLQKSLVAGPFPQLQGSGLRGGKQEICGASGLQGLSSS